MNKAPLSSNKNDWRTPKKVLDVVRKVGPIKLDPCASKDKRHWFAELNWTDYNEENYDAPVDGLSFMNPPYGRKIDDWVDRWHDGFAEGIIALLPARPGSCWYREMWSTSEAYCFWNGRITFVGAPSPAPFPSIFFYKGKRKWKFCDVFSQHGDVGIL